LLIVAIADCDGRSCRVDFGGGPQSIRKRLLAISGTDDAAAGFAFEEKRGLAVRFGSASTGVR